MSQLSGALTVLLILSLSQLCCTSTYASFTNRQRHGLHGADPASLSHILNMIRVLSGGADEEELSVIRTTDNDASWNTHETHKTMKQGIRRHQLSHLISSTCEPDPITQESFELRKGILTRTNEYLEDLFDDNWNQPKKLLHSIASRIPAIKHSPDFRLKITSARPTVDAGIAAFSIGAVARACELYQARALLQRNNGEESTNDAASDIVADRRFEQLVECVLCGVDVRKSKQQQKKLSTKEKSDKAEINNEDESTAEDNLSDKEDELDYSEEEVAQISEGLSVRDSCRAAWGVALLARRREKSEQIGGETINDIIVALATRSRELLITRLKSLKGSAHVEAPSRSERKEISKGLAQDAACAMWTFACVDACTGIKSYNLFQDCCSLLCEVPHPHIDLEAGLDDSNYAVDEVLDRLERSEDVGGPVDGDLKDEHENRDAATDILLDSLSPNELTDVLWSIAMHGTEADEASGAQSSETSLLREEDRTLPETVEALREVAFDRLVAWLRRDLALVSRKNHKNGTSSGEEMPLVDEESQVGNDGIATSSEDATTVPATAENIETTVDESLILSHGDDLQQGEEVEVVDAATLLGLSAENDVDTNLDDGGSDSAPIESSESPDSYEIDGPVDVEATVVDEPPDQSTFRLFSVHDLCSIAWAVTDLRDTLRFLVVDLVTQIFAELSSEGLKRLPGFDKSNLVWAIARCSSRKPPETEMEAPLSLMVAEWVAESCLIQSQPKIDDDNIASHSNLLGILRPPELSRLMWSMACIVRSHGGKTTEESAISKLSLHALCVASSNLSMFVTEDLARIGWAYLELWDSDYLTSDVITSQALGRIVATIETSLLRWESGQKSDQYSSKSSGEKKKASHSVRHTTFFGRPRLSKLIRPMLEQRLGGVDEEDEEDSESFSVPQSTTLPLLRDLTVDPSTLCKFASGLCKYAKHNNALEDVWTTLRVAVRLLTSKNGQLLKQCGIHNIVHLCHACATFQGCPDDRELILRLMSRRTVQVLNESFEAQRAANATVAPLLEAAAPWELCTLYWSLGRLGTRHCVSDKNVRMAHRRLHLVTSSPLLSEDQLVDLSFTSLIELLHGMVSMNTEDRALLKRVLAMLRSKASSSSRFGDLCDLTECVARAQRVIAHPALLRSGKGIYQVQKEKKIPENAESDATDLTKGEGLSRVINGNETETELTLALANSSDTENATFDLCSSLLADVAEKAMEELPSSTASEMKRLLLVYSVLPLRMDELVDAIEKQVRFRVTALNLATSTNSSPDIKSLVKDAADDAVEAANAITERSDQVEILHDTNEYSNSSALIHRSAASACEAVARLERLERGVNTNAETICSRVEEKAAFELGRCQELIASYRRIDFGTGTRESRYDKKRGFGIQELALSRLLPFDE